MSKLNIIDTNSDDILKYGVCGYKNIKRPGFPEKIGWLKARFTEGLKLKTLHSDEDGTQGMIEYLPGEYCWRPVDAAGYTFIHCIISGYKRCHKNKGYGSLLLDACLKDAKKKKTYGVAVVTRKGSFMVGSRIFLKHGFEVVDTGPPDFELLVKKFKNRSPAPRFRSNRDERSAPYKKGLTIMRSDQCPYTVKNVNEICATAQEQFKIKPHVITLNDCKAAQNSPCAFGTFCMVFNGKLIAAHPISNGRFKNIMNQIQK